WPPRRRLRAASASRRSSVRGPPRADPGGGSREPGLPARSFSWVVLLVESWNATGRAKGVSNVSKAGYISVRRRNQLGMNMLIAHFVVFQAPPVDYADAMKKVAAKFSGKEGVVLHLGDSITY